MKIGDKIQFKKLMWKIIDIRTSNFNHSYVYGLYRVYRLYRVNGKNRWLNYTMQSYPISEQEFKYYSKKLKENKNWFYNMVDY